MNRRQLGYPVIAVCVALLLVVGLAVYVSSSTTHSSTTTTTSPISAANSSTGPCNICVSALQYAYPGEELGFNVTVTGLPGSPAFWNVSMTYPNQTLVSVSHVYIKSSNGTATPANLASTQPSNFTWEFPVPAQAPAGSYTLTVRGQYQDNVYHGDANFTVPRLNSQPGG
jgi:hypothetical protein